MNIVYLFSGQGSQYRGIGRRLFLKERGFKNSIEASDEIVRTILNRSLISELYHTKNPSFNDILITNPTIVAIEIAMIDLLLSRGIQPDFVFGHSLGEYAAAVAKGVLNAEAAIKMSIEQAKAVLNANIFGGMISVLAENSEFMKKEYSKYSLYLASSNFEKSFTISGTNNSLESFQSFLEKHSVPYWRLPVNHPFHSELMPRQLDGFKPDVIFKPPEAGLFSSLTYDFIDKVPDNYFWDIATSVTNFEKVVNRLECSGPNCYLDLGPSGTMSSFFKYNLKSSSDSITFPILTQFHKEVEQLTIIEKFIKERIAI